MNESIKKFNLIWIGKIRGGGEGWEKGQVGSASKKYLRK